MALSPNVHMASAVLARSYNCRMTGLILFAHGARDPRWAEPFERLKRKVEAARPGLAGRARLSWKSCSRTSPPPPTR